MVLTLPQLLVYLLIAIIAAYLAGMIIHTAYPLGFVGAFLAGLIGEWLMLNVFHILLAPEISYAGIPIITALVGALILALIWAVAVSGGRRRHWV